jgi:hypothetical protein
MVQCHVHCWLSLSFLNILHRGRDLAFSNVYLYSLCHSNPLKHFCSSILILSSLQLHYPNFCHFQSANLVPNCEYEFSNTTSQIFEMKILQSHFTSLTNNDTLLLN